MRRWIQLLAAGVCATFGCGDGGSQEADGGTECFDDYVVFTMGVTDPDAGFVEIENGDDLAVTFMPTGLTAVVVSLRARGIDATRAELTLELVADGATVSQGSYGAFVEAPLGYEWPQLLIFFEQFPDAHIGQTLNLRGRITDYCDRTVSAERAVTLVDGR